MFAELWGSSDAGGCEVCLGVYIMRQASRAMGAGRCNHSDGNDCIVFSNAISTRKKLEIKTAFDEVSEIETGKTELPS